MRRLGAALPALLLIGLAGCTASSPGPPAATPTGPSPARPTRLEPTPIAEPTTTNTLPPPPAPTAPAPSTAGSLNASALPTPKGWRTAVREGGEEEGYLGNGTWVHARDPRYAAFDAITIGCADITRDDYSDPVAALEGTYESNEGEPGIGLVLEFPTADAAGRYWQRYREQVRACTADEPVRIEMVTDDSVGLIDRRRYPDADWTEIGRISGTRVALIILSDPGHRIPASATRNLLAQLGR